MIKPKFYRFIVNQKEFPKKALKNCSYKGRLKKQGCRQNYKNSKKNSYFLPYLLLRVIVLQLQYRLKVKHE